MLKLTLFYVIYKLEDDATSCLHGTGSHAEEHFECAQWGASIRPLYLLRTKPTHSISLGFSSKLDGCTRTSTARIFRCWHWNHNHHSNLMCCKLCHKHWFLWELLFKDILKTYLQQNHVHATQHALKHFPLDISKENVDFSSSLNISTTQLLALRSGCDWL